MSNIIWIDENIYNKENIEYAKELEKIGYKNIRLFQKVSDAFDCIGKIQFEEIKIIISGKLFSDFINTFKANIIKMCLVPKIIIFTKNKTKFLENNQDYNKAENKFYTFGGIATRISEIKEFLSKEDKNIISNDSNNNSISLIKLDESKEKEKNFDAQLTFEYIDNKEKLILPMTFSSLLDEISNENIEKYTKSLYNLYSKESEKIKTLLEQIIHMKNIPIEILCKYYIRLYSLNSKFQTELNIDLRLNKKDKYLPFIKLLYEGVRLKSLPLSRNNILYRGGSLNNEEINKIQKYLKNKIDGLPSLIVFSKSFLSFSKDENEAKKFLRNIYKGSSKVLFILMNDSNEDYNLSTHADIEKISYYPKEKEVLFFPFSSFEIKDIKEINNEKEKSYEIHLLYLGKYLKIIENNENKLPESEFKNQLNESRLIEEEKLEEINTKTLYDTFKQYEKDIKKNNININNDILNYIVGEISIGADEVNKDIRIINSFENVKREEKREDKNEDWKFENEKEIKENIEIKINGELINFTYNYNFKTEGNYEICYFFKNNLTKTNHMFYECESLIYLDLSNLETKNVTNMSAMFGYCNSLTNLDLSNFNTQNVADMSCMFCGCGALMNLNLFYFNTQNVTDMMGMFSGCNSLIYLNLSNFNTQKVINMSCMFYNCISLKYLYLSNFITQNVTCMISMFGDCKSLEGLDLSNFNTVNVSNMRAMFGSCSSLTYLNLSSFDTKNVTDMSHMFYDCKSLTNLDLSNFNTQKVTKMIAMFSGCKSLKDLNLSNFNTQNVTDMNNIFNDCEFLMNLDLSKDKFKNIKNNIFNKDNPFIKINSLNLNSKETKKRIKLNNQKGIDMRKVYYPNDSKDKFFDPRSLSKNDSSNINDENDIDINGTFYGFKILKKNNFFNRNNKIPEEKIKIEHNDLFNFIFDEQL